MLVELTYRGPVPLSVGDHVPVENRWGVVEEAEVMSISFRRPPSEPVSLDSSLNRIRTEEGVTLVSARLPDTFGSPMV